MSERLSKIYLRLRVKYLLLLLYFNRSGTFSAYFRKKS